MTAKTCPFCSIALTKNNRCTDPDFAGCELCFEEASLENEHQDGFHDEEAKVECPRAMEQKGQVLAVISVLPFGFVVE